MRKNIFSKIKLILKRPKEVLVVGRAKETARQCLSDVIGSKKPPFPVLVVTHFGEYHPEREFFAAERDELEDVLKLVEKLPPQGYLILNFDDETVRELKQKTRAHVKTFGFGIRADFRASDVVVTQYPSRGTNFKINYEGNIVPVWLKNLFGKEHIYAALAAAAAGEILDLNLIEISQALKSYQGLPGKMKLIEGVKKTWILDDSANASSLSMLEALKILGKIKADLPAGRQGRKIAVLGDILGIGKYSLEAHEALGREAAVVSDLLFTVGSRAKFLAKGAFEGGMSEDKIFKFDDVKQAAPALQSEIRTGDLILVDGSKEMNMIEVVKEIRV